MAWLHYGLVAIALLTLPIAVADIPFVFDRNISEVTDFTYDQLKEIHASSPDVSGIPVVSNPDDSEILEFYTTAGSDNGTKKSMRVGDLKKIFDSRVGTGCRPGLVHAYHNRHNDKQSWKQNCSKQQWWRLQLYEFQRGSISVSMSVG